MSGYSEVKHDPGKGVDTLPMYPTGGYQMNAGAYQIQPNVVHHPDVDHINSGEDCFQDACCTPDEKDRKSDDDDVPIIPEKYLNLDFDSCFHEHKSTKTVPIVYKINGYIFKYTKLVFYNLFVILFGFLLSFLWGIVLGILAFVLNWLWNPAFKAFIIVINTTLPAVTEPLKAFFTPLVDVHARVFRQIRVQGWLNGGLLSPLVKKEEHVA